MMWSSNKNMSEKSCQFDASLVLCLLAVTIISEALPALKMVYGHDDDELTDLDKGDAEYGISDLPLEELSLDCGVDLFRRLSKSRGVLHFLLQLARCKYVQDVTGVNINDWMKDFREFVGVRRTPKHVKKSALGKFFSANPPTSATDSDGDSSLDSTPPSSTEAEFKE